MAGTKSVCPAGEELLNAEAVTDSSGMAQQLASVLSAACVSPSTVQLMLELVLSLLH